MIQKHGQPDHQHKIQHGNCGMITGKGIEDFTQNEFDPETGLCLGNGEYCGNIKEHYEMPIVIAVKQSEEDEEKDQRK